MDRERVLESASPEATEALGAALGALLLAGTVVALSGELGAGKTCFTRGVARGLGIESGVASPTYVLMQAHEGGRLPLYHFDAWMEGREKALLADGGAEWLHGDGVALIEWAGRVAEWLATPRLEVALHHLAPERRRIVLRVVAREGGGPLARLVASLALPAGVREIETAP